jgi:hypothetical protein
MTENPLARPASCPAWCTSEHGIYAGEDDHLHTGAKLYLTTEISARLCATIDPATGATDGPYLLVNGEEWTLEHARSVGEALVALAAAADVPTALSGTYLS